MREKELSEQKRIAREREREGMIKQTEKDCQSERQGMIKRTEKDCQRERERRND